MTINEIIIEKSRFITYLKRVDTIDDATTFINQIKKKHYDANHRCLAFVIDNGQIMRSSDDGEPSGTAGIPILQCLKNNDITNTICIVVRYFGGIKLGTGGLVRAYSRSTSEALNKSKFVQKTVFKQFEITYDYSFVSPIEKLLMANSVVINTSFDIRVTTIYATNDNLIDNLNNITKGNIIIHQLDDISLDLDIS